MLLIASYFGLFRSNHLTDLMDFVDNQSVAVIIGFLILIPGYDLWKIQHTRTLIDSHFDSLVNYAYRIVTSNYEMFLSLKEDEQVNLKSSRKDLIVYMARIRAEVSILKSILMDENRCQILDELINEIDKHNSKSRRMRKFLKTIKGSDLEDEKFKMNQLINNFVINNRKNMI
jgi:hypothetical protein